LKIKLVKLHKTIPIVSTSTRYLWDDRAATLTGWGRGNLKANATESVDLPDNVYYDGALLWGDHGWKLGEHNGLQSIPQRWHLGRAGWR
jgi:hypothetical protein